MTLFESMAYDEFDAPFDSIDDLARFILNWDNDALLFKALRAEIAARGTQPDQSPNGYIWSMMTVALIRGLPEARVLFAEHPRSYDQICIACKVLDRAVAILRGAA